MVSFFFFFSSRRRHTRCGRDWSSDVCSSDLFRFSLARAGQYKLSLYWPGDSPAEGRAIVTLSGPGDIRGRDEVDQRSGGGAWVDIRRSEEHTSELQSRPHLVCRLLLEKKNMHKMLP